MKYENQKYQNTIRHDVGEKFSIIYIFTLQTLLLLFHVLLVSVLLFFFDFCTSVVYVLRCGSHSEHEFINLFSYF